MTTTTPQRIGGWLLGPLAWLLVALLSTTLALLLYTAALSSPQTFQTLGGQALTTQILWGFLLLPLSPCGITHCG